MNKKHTLESVRSAFEKEGYTLLSTEYKNTMDKLQFICPNGHHTEISYKSWLKGCRCQKCSKSLKLDYQFVKESFEKEGYTLISDYYDNNDQLLDFICPNNHKYQIRYRHWKDGHRCAKCAGVAKLDFLSVKKDIEKFGFELLDNNYEGNKLPLKLRCKNGHIIKKSYDGIKSGSGCKFCAKENTAKKLSKNFSDVKYLVEEAGFTLLSESYTNARHKLVMMCNKNKHVIEKTADSIQQGKGCPFCSHIHSKAELEIYDLIKQYFPDAINGDRIQIHPLELDIYIPSKKLAIEYCGIYWHSEKAGTPKDYHLHKLEECTKKGIKLITIFENEWNTKQDIVKSVLKAKLGIIENKIYARNCTIQEIDTNTKDVFLESNHLQGKDYSSVRLGAFYNNELVAVMTFSKGSIAKGAKLNNNEYELNRFAIKQNYAVVGIASRLLKYFNANYSPIKIYSFSDRRWSTGDLYNKIGFTFIHNTKPNYWYFFGTDINLYHRYNFRKSELPKKLEDFNPNMTEWKNMVDNGFNRIWDCGNSRWEV